MTYLSLAVRVISFSPAYFSHSTSFIGDLWSNSNPIVTVSCMKVSITRVCTLGSGKMGICNGSLKKYFNYTRQTDKVIRKRNYIGFILGIKLTFSFDDQLERYRECFIVSRFHLTIVVA